MEPGVYLGRCVYRLRCANADSYVSKVYSWYPECCVHRIKLTSISQPDLCDHGTKCTSTTLVSTEQSVQVLPWTLCSKKIIHKNYTCVLKTKCTKLILARPLSPQNKAYKYYPCVHRAKCTSTTLTKTSFRSHVAAAWWQWRWRLYTDMNTTSSAPSGSQSWVSVIP